MMYDESPSDRRKLVGKRPSARKAFSPEPMDVETEEDANLSIGERKRKVREFKEEHDRALEAYERQTPRQKAVFKAKYGNSMEGQEYLNKKAKIAPKRVNGVKMWDEVSRPGFRLGLLASMLRGLPVKKHPKYGYTMYRLPDGKYYPKKSELDKRGLKGPHISIDHKKNWREYILDYGDCDEHGKITQAGAIKAYNDTRNLVLMSNIQNSAKNAPKGKID